MLSCIPIRVECYSGYRAEQEPRVLCWSGRRLLVDRIIDRWLQGGADPSAAEAEYFKVRTVSGEQYIIKNDHSLHAWFLVSGPEDPPKKA
jgi:hypothetical protein